MRKNRGLCVSYTPSVLLLASSASLLASCQTPAQVASRADERAVEALEEVSALKDRIAELDRKTRDLEDENKRQNKYVEAVAASLDEARQNHTSLRSTLNKNVDVGNKRDAAQESDIDWLMARHGVIRNR